MPKTAKVDSQTTSDDVTAKAAEAIADALDDEETVAWYQKILPFITHYASIAGSFLLNLLTQFLDLLKAAAPIVWHWSIRILLEFVLPMLILYAVYRLIRYLYTQVMRLHVNGKPNEWVLIINNGKMKKKGIGLTCFCGPFDQVATFPAKVHQVNFTSEQVTSEMQGVQVSGMIVWSINRNGDGPFNAYKNLGEDLYTGSPRIANANLVSMSEAIVRTAIALSTTKQILSEREQLRQKIRDEMSEVVKGWGVWLETVEITDVVIKSQPVFKDLQAEYRERIKHVAETYRMKIRSEIDEIRKKKQQELDEKKSTNSADLYKYTQNVEMEKKKLTRMQNVRINAEQKKILDMNYELREWTKNLSSEQEIESKKLSHQQDIATESTTRENQLINREIEVEDRKYHRMVLDYRLEGLTMEETAKISRAKKLADLKKANTSKQMQKLDALETAEEVFMKVYFNKVFVQQEKAEDDPATKLFNKWFEAGAKK